MLGSELTVKNIKSVVPVIKSILFLWVKGYLRVLDAGQRTPALAKECGGNL